MSQTKQGRDGTTSLRMVLLGSILGFQVLFHPDSKS